MNVRAWVQRSRPAGSRWRVSICVMVRAALAVRTFGSAIRPATFPGLAGLQNPNLARIRLEERAQGRL